MIVRYVTLFAKLLLRMSLLVVAFTPALAFSQSTSEKALVGSTWSGSGASGDPRVKLVYVMRFNSDSVTIESTCRSNVVESTLKSEVRAVYLDPVTVRLEAGVGSQIPTDRGTCTVNFPANLEFHVEANRLMIGYDGTYQTTDMKRQN